MYFKDIGIIIAKRQFKENATIITAFTKNHGLYSGVVKESLKKYGSTYQEGNIINFSWQARLHEHLGMAKCELIKSYSAPLISDKTKLYAFNSIISLIKTAFHERENHNNFFSILIEYIRNLANNFNFQDYIKFELAILSETGYKLELNKCAITGSKKNLCYVSPKSGRAICSSVGFNYREKLLILPEFLNSPSLKINVLERKHAFNLTTYFLNRYLFNNYKQPFEREIFIDYILNLSC